MLPDVVSKLPQNTFERLIKVKQSNSVTLSSNKDCTLCMLVTVLCWFAAGNDQKSGTAAAPQQPPSAQATAGPQAEVTGPPALPLSPTASSASPRPSTTQVPGPGTGSQSLQQPGRASAMPLGAVDMSRAGGPAPALADDNGAEDVTTGLVRH